MFSRLPSYSIAIIKVYHIISYIYYIIFILKLNQHHWSFYRMVLDLSTPSRTDVTWYLIKFGVVWDIHMMWLHASNATIQSRNRVDRFSATELLHQQCVISIHHEHVLSYNQEAIHTTSEMDSVCTKTLLQDQWEFNVAHLRSTQL